jgi:hypothetical protein
MPSSPTVALYVVQQCSQILDGILRSVALVGNAWQIKAITGKAWGEKNNRRAPALFTPSPMNQGAGFANAVKKRQ